VPLTVIPLGTANNIATSLGIAGDIDAVVAAWAEARPIAFDLGLARGPWGERRFVESMGAGLVARGIAAMDTEAPHPEEGDPYAMLRKARCRFADVLDAMQPRRCRVTIDGAEREGDLLLVEILNTSSIGPRLALAPASRGDDGLFDVVTAGEPQRAALERVLRADADGEWGEVELPTERGTSVELFGWDCVHLDDRVIDGLGGAMITTTVERAAIEVLAPRR
jgi:diacylglycerol kinase family enzyme